jgi:hypothetical protein
MMSEQQIGRYVVLVGTEPFPWLGALNGGKRAK